MSELVSFLLTTGRTLSQMALYSPDHPTVKGAIEEAHRLLSAVLAQESELSLGLNEGNLIVNGRLPENVSEGTLRPFVHLLNTYDLHSLTFLPGIERKELLPFFNLAYRKDLKKEKVDVNAYLTGQLVSHIKVNQARYEKVAEDEKITQEEEVIPEPGAASDLDFLKSTETLPLDQFLKKLVEKAVGDPNDRKVLLDRVTSLIRKEIEDAVETQTKALRKEKLRATNERDRTEGVVETMADGVVVVDEQGCVLMMNQAAEEMYGVSLGQCVGKPLWEGVRQEQMVALAKDLSTPVDRPLVKEVEVRARQDTRKTLRASTAAVQDPEGRVVGMVSVLSDVTKQRELTRMQNEFMANVTHDLRAPIHALKLAIAAILEGASGDVNAEMEKMLKLADKNAERLNRLINDLLDFSQIETGRIRIQPQEINLGPLFRDTAATFDPWARKRGIRLTYEENEPPPPVFADPDRILQIVSNLISNALKFTPEGGDVKLRVQTTSAGARKEVRIEVVDSGKGISKEDQDRIFQRFIQLKNDEKHDVRGTGLGLSICRALVEAHKSHLRVQSPPQGSTTGSRFYFTLSASHRSGKQVPDDSGTPQGDEKSAEKKSFWERFWRRIRAGLVLFLLLPDFLHARPYWGRVRRVLEGDRIQLESGETVRYLGIDAPDRGNPFFTEALAANRSWVEKKEVRLAYGLQEKDPEGTWLAYVFVDGVLVNYQLVLEGMALVTRLSNEETYLPKLLAAQRKAHKKKRGLWREWVVEGENQAP